MSGIPVKFKYVYDKPREEIVDWLREPDIQKALRENDMYKFYDILSDKVYQQGYGGYNIGDITNFLFSCGVNIFDYVDMIPDFCFSGQAISHIEIPDNVSELGEGSFYGTNLEHITIPGRIKNIPYYCLSDIYNLESIALEDGVETIDDMAFSYLTEIEINFPSSIKSIGHDAFNSTDHVQADCRESRYAFDYCSSNPISAYSII